MDDNNVEHAIKRAGMTAPRVTPDQVNAIMARVQFDTRHIEGTTTTISMANLVSRDGQRKFTLAIGHSACVSPENFDAKIGIDIARSKAEQLAKDKLWELLGFSLFQEMDQ